MRSGFRPEFRGWVIALAVCLLGVSALALPSRGVVAQQGSTAGQAGMAEQEDQHRAWAKDAKPAGSKSCEKCHYEQYQRWKDSGHSSMLRLPGPDSVGGDFTRDNVLQYKGYTYTMTTRDGKYFVTQLTPQGVEKTYQVDYVVGWKRLQAYLTILPDGRYYILPSYWHLIRRSWFDSSLVTPNTKEGIGVKQYWNVNCLPCHATDLKATYDATTGQYTTTMLEPGIGCEACHNPGSKHNEFFEKKPQRDYVRGELNDTFISNQRFFDPIKSTELCATCHATKNNYFKGYWPGDETYDYFTPIQMTFHGPDKQGDWYADGHPTRFNHYMEFMGSRCFLEGNATCVSCHEGHSSPNDSLLIVPLEQSNLLCLTCHQEKYGGTKLVQHTFHLPDSPGSRCYACHMGESLERIMMHRRDHSLDNPLPENTIRFGIPNTCNNRDCHPDKTPEWAVRTLDQWYGSANRQKVLYAADMMWRARTKDASVIPLLVRAMNDPNLRITMRTSAVAALGNYFGPAAQSAVPALVNLLAETREVYKRPFQVAAAQALGFIGDLRAVDPLTNLLDSPYRIVRLTSAFSLLNLGVTDMEGENGPRLARAQAEYVQALRTWPDVPEFRVNLGGYHILRKNYAEALAELQIAIRINPELPDAYYLAGRAYAFQGQFKQALDSWKKARELKSTYPDIDRLIDAAEKALKPPQE